VAAEAHDPIEADLDLEERDFVEAFLALERRSRPANQVLLAIVVTVSAAAIFARWSLEPGVWMLMLPLVLYRLVFSTSSTRARARRRFDTTHRGWLGMTLQLTDTEVRWSSALVESYRPWSDFSSWIETDHLFIVTVRGTNDIWPKRAFAPRALPALREVLQAKITDRPAAPTTPTRETTRGPGMKVLLASVAFSALIVLYGLWWSAT